MNLAAGQEFYQKALTVPRSNPENEALVELLARAKEAVLEAWLEHLYDGSDNAA